MNEAKDSHALVEMQLAIRQELQPVLERLATMEARQKAREERQQEDNWGARIRTLETRVAVLEPEISDLEVTKKALDLVNSKVVDLQTQMHYLMGKIAIVTAICSFVAAFIVKRFA